MYTRLTRRQAWNPKAAIWYVAISKLTADLHKLTTHLKAYASDMGLGLPLWT
jgi:hypothetical protein